MPGNDAVVHHALVYIDAESQSDALADADGKYHPCFGGPEVDGALIDVWVGTHMHYVGTNMRLSVNSMNNPHVVEALAQQGLDAPLDVYLGEETLDEMCLGVFGFAAPYNP